MSSFLDSLLQRCARLLDTFAAKRGEEAVKEYLGFTLLVTLDVLGNPGDELCQSLLAIFMHDVSPGRSESQRLYAKDVAGAIRPTRRNIDRAGVSVTFEAKNSHSGPKNP